MHRPHRWIAAAALGLLVLTLSGCNPSGDRAETAAFQLIYRSTGTCTTTSRTQLTSGGTIDYHGYCGVNGQRDYLFTSEYTSNTQGHVWFDQNVPHTNPWFGCSGATVTKGASGNWLVSAIVMC